MLNKRERDECISIITSPATIIEPRYATEERKPPAENFFHFDG